MEIFARCTDAVAACQQSKRFAIAVLSDEEKPRSMHNHDCLEIYFSVSGGRQFFVDGRLYENCDGDLFVINQFETHKPVLVDGVHHERIVLCVAPEYPASLSTMETDLSACFYQRPPGFSHRVHLHHAERAQFLALINRCKGAQGYGADVVENTCFTELMLLIGSLYVPERPVVSATESSHAGELVSSMLDYINQRIAEPLTIERMSEQFYLSRGYLCRLFKQETGATINKYIVARRISIAKRLLADGATVHEACEQSGFGDYAHFIRAFGQAVGISPKQYALKVG